MRLRPARPSEAAALAALELDAGRRFAEAGLPGDLEGLSVAVYEAAIAAGTTWVAADTGDVPVGLARCWERPSCLHLRELDVRPSHMRRGIGALLVERVCAEARARSLEQVTLTTFRDVPWNAPYCARRGFAVLDEAAMPAWLRAIREEEDAAALARWPRVALARRVGSR